MDAADISGRRREGSEMSLHCLKCDEVWTYEDYVCPMCGSATVDSASSLKPTLKYTFQKGQGGEPGTYDVIGLATGKSIFDEPENDLNREED